jgi:hypothetical protein
LHVFLLVFRFFTAIREGKGHDAVEAAGTAQNRRIEFSGIICSGDDDYAFVSSCPVQVVEQALQGDVGAVIQSRARNVRAR